MISEAPGRRFIVVFDLRAEVWFEYFVSYIRRDSGAFVGNRNSDISAVIYGEMVVTVGDKIVSGNRDVPALRHCFARVSDNVMKNVSHLGRIGAYMP